MTDTFLARRWPSYPPLEQMDDDATLTWAPGPPRPVPGLAGTGRRRASTNHGMARGHSGTTIARGFPHVMASGFFVAAKGSIRSRCFWFAKATKADPTPLLDPNTLSDDGTGGPLQTVDVSPCGELVAYCTSEAGSDITMHVRRVADGTDLPDTLTNLRHSDATWDLDASGFVYALPVSPNGTPDPTGKRRAVYHPLWGQHSTTT
ncbi:MAG: hypothetical protein R2857_13125 [Vampirovibrionales bacterium]